MINSTYTPSVHLFVDMDGTLVTWKQAACFEELLQENYFRDLPPYKEVVDAINWLNSTYPEIDVHILSAYMPENPYSVNEKTNGWTPIFRLFPRQTVSLFRAASAKRKLQQKQLANPLSILPVFCWTTTLSTCMTGKKMEVAASSFVTASTATAVLGEAILSVDLLPVWKLPTISGSTSRKFPAQRITAGRSNRHEAL